MVLNGPEQPCLNKSNIAPDLMHVANGAVDMTRPLSPYPQVAVYKATGSTNDATNFACKAR